MSYFKRFSAATAGLVATLGVVCSAPVFAGPIIHNGATFQVVATAVDADTVDFQYTADFTAPGWIGSGGLDYIIAIDFKLGGYDINTIDSFSTNATGGWVSSFGPTSAGGCQGSNSTFGCAEDDPFDESTAQLTAGIVAWSFRASFTTSVDPDDFLLDNNHIGAFFQRCSDKNNGSRQCKNGLGLSQTVGFNPGTDPDPPSSVPTPGTLVLVGLSLLGLRFSSRRRRPS